MNTTKSWFTTTRSITTTTLSCFGVLALALGLTGCVKKLDMTELNKTVSDGLASKVGLASPAVTCPTEARPFKAGDTFDCDVKPTEGGHLVVKVTQKDDQGNITWEVTKSEGLIDLKKTEEAITKGLKDQANAVATVDCGGGAKKMRAAKTGETFDCKATTTADGTVHTVTVTAGADGNVTWAIHEQGAGAAPAEGAETPEPEQH